MSFDVSAKRAKPCFFPGGPGLNPPAPPPPQQKHSVKICFLPFHEAFDSFSYFKNRAPRNNPGMHSWMTSRNALLGDLQEHAPVHDLGTYSGTLPEC